MPAILPGATLGVMGGGQLGRMFVHAAQRMGYSTAVLDPDEHSPAGLVSHHHIRTRYLDREGLARLAQCSAAITTEFENVPAASLEQLAATRPVAPGAAAVAVAQDRLLEKAHFVRCGVPCAPHAAIRSAADATAAPDGLLPGILKTARLGYDGKGQAQVATRDELLAQWKAMGEVDCVLERRVPLVAEYSVIVARGGDGQVVAFPPQRNRHRGGILAVTEVHEGNMPPQQAQLALRATESIAKGLGYVGVLCVEFFALADGSLVANEMAPRPHNSGHYTMDACDQSQFDLQVRALAGLPLAAPRLHSAAVMLNLLGDLWLLHADTPAEPPWADVVALPGAHLHLYGKAEARRGRKMGHLTLTAANPADARTVALRACALLGIVPYGDSA